MSLSLCSLCCSVCQLVLRACNAACDWSVEQLLLSPGCPFRSELRKCFQPEEAGKRAGVLQGIDGAAAAVLPASASAAFLTEQKAITLAKELEEELTRLAAAGKDAAEVAARSSKEEGREDGELPHVDLP